MSGLSGDLRSFMKRTANGELEPADILRRYLDSGDFSGGGFDSYASDRAIADVITGDDILATTLLAIEVRMTSHSGITPAAAIAMETRRDEVTTLLKQVPDDVQLHDLSKRDFQRLLGDRSSPGSELFRLLRNEFRLPRIATYKLLARKRPHLLPIRDTVVEQALHQADPWWQPWWEQLTTSPDLVTTLSQIRREAEVEQLSILRVADILVWMRQRGADQVEGLRAAVGTAISRL